MVEDKLVRRSFWVGEIACSSRAYHKHLIKKQKTNTILWLSGLSGVLLILFTEVQILLKSTLFNFFSIPIFPLLIYDYNKSSIKLLKN